MKLRLRESRAALPQIQQTAPEGAFRYRFRIESLLGIGETLTSRDDFLFGMQLRTACGRLNAGSAAVASLRAAAGKPTGLS